MTITEFLLARIAEDEEVSRAAAESDPSSQGYTKEGPAGVAWTSHDGMVCGETDALWDCEGSATLCTTPEVSEHIARHDPARILAECAAKRFMIQNAVAWDGPPDGTYSLGAVQATWQAVLRSLATVYADHPDYQPEWTP